MISYISSYFYNEKPKEEKAMPAMPGGMGGGMDY